MVVVLALAVVVGLHHAGRAKAASRLSHSLRPPARVRFGVGLARCTFVDNSRTTPNYATGTATKGRTLVTEIRYPVLASALDAGEIPDAHPARRHGPFPLVVFGAGYALDPGVYAKLLDYWVRAGFVVAAPIYPDTNAQAVRALPPADINLAEADDVNQPADDAFVTRQLLRSSAGDGRCSIVRGLIDPSAVALAGQSDGATTAVALAFDPRYESPGLRFRAVVDLSGELFGAGTLAPDRLVVTPTSPAIFVSQSATDTCNPPQFSTQVYDALPGAHRWFLKINRADHLPPYIGSDPAAFRVVSRATTYFLTKELEGRSPGRSLLEVGNADPAVATISDGASAPSLPTLTLSGATCYLRH